MHSMSTSIYRHHVRTSLSNPVLDGILPVKCNIDHSTMNHAQDQLFYRCYSDTSAGRLRSGEYYDGHPALTSGDLLVEFDRHRMLGNREPTALVSVTERPLEAVQRALAKYRINGEPPKTIWVVIIRVPGGKEYQKPHHARKLAKTLGLKDADVFNYEYLFEWEIPREYIEHTISVERLIYRKIEQLLGLHNLAYGFPGFRELQDTLLDCVLEPDLYGTGRWLGALAQAMCPRNSIYEVAFHILRSLPSGWRIYEHQQIVSFNLRGQAETLDFSDICVIELGIRDQLDSYFGI
ncbi:hypothetical protein BJY00DRAFT_280447 [Aspergillus carlsbadensis]|nr:hypothetical protein BJY00DRAFT_280447 [Aspergillus carlsbadensis]